MEIGAGVCQDHTCIYHSARLLGFSSSMLVIFIKWKRNPSSHHAWAEVYIRTWVGLALIFQMAYHRMDVILGSQRALIMPMLSRYQASGSVMVKNNKNRDHVQPTVIKVK